MPSTTPATKTGPPTPGSATTATPTSRPARSAASSGVRRGGRESRPSRRRMPPSAELRRPVDHVVAEREGNGLGTASYAELAQDVLDVRRDRLRADEELLRDLRLPEPLCEQ